MSSTATTPKPAAAPRPPKPSLPRRLSNYGKKAAGWVRYQRRMAAVRGHDVLSVHRIDPSNLGDLVCAPRLYVDSLAASHPLDINFCRDPRALAGKSIILGGGGLLFPAHDRQIDCLLAAENAQRIVWGAGMNVHGSDSFEVDPRLERFDLVGLRDHGTPYDWVPCASCLSTEFDRQHPIRHEIVEFSHHYYATSADPGIPRLTNDTIDLGRVVEFLASGEVVLTSSYHGAYWATLLGRKVIVLDAFSNKFLRMKHQPVLATTDTWRGRLGETRSFPGALAECRTANLTFAARVEELLAARGLSPK